MASEKRQRSPTPRRENDRIDALLTRAIALCTLAGLLGGGAGSWAILGRRVDDLEKGYLIQQTEIKEGREEVKKIQLEYGPQLAVVSNRLGTMENSITSLNTRIEDLIKVLKKNSEDK